MLEARNLRKSFGRLRVLDGVSLSAKKGQVLGIVGASGCWKSTLLKVLAGLLRPDNGSVSRTAGAPLAMVFQNPVQSLDPRLKVSDILLEALLIRGTGNKKNGPELIESMLKSVDLLPALADRLPYQLSGGECQRVAIARALSIEPGLLLCDEPLSSLDILAQARMLNLFLKLNQTRGLGMVFVSHDRRAV